jgi:hypothetical protein
VVEVDLSVPNAFNLSQNYPNPFNPSTVINFGLPVKSDISLVVYNSIGQLVKNMAQGTYDAGNFSITFNASDLTSGIYFYTLSAKGSNGKEFVQSNKMLFLK